MAKTSGEKSNTIIERSEIFTIIDKIFSSSNIISLYGQSGVGKSTLAYQYALKLNNFSVKWINSDSIEKLEINYVEKFVKEFYKTNFNDILSKSKKEIIISINKKLFKSKNLLLIFDNLRLEDGVSELFGLISENIPLNTKCLITTKETSPDLLKTCKNNISIVGFKRSEAELMLLNIIGDRISERVNNVELILNIIGTGKDYSPLEIRNMCSFFGYFKEIKVNELVQILKGNKDALRFILYDNLFEEDLSFARLLKTIVFLDPDFMSFNFLKHLASLNNELELSSSISSLKSLFLIEQNELSSKKNGLKMHRETQHEIANFILNFRTHEIEPIYEAHLSKFSFIIRKTKELNIEINELVQHLIRFLSCFKSKANKKAKNLIDEAVLYNHIAFYFDNKLNNARIALKYKKETLAIYLKILAPNNPTIRALLVNIGLDHRELAEPKESNEFLYKAIEFRNDSVEQNEDDEERAITLNYIGLNWLDLNEYATSIQYLLESFHIYAKYSKKYALKMADILQKLSEVHNKLGSYRESIDFIHKTLEIEHEILEPDHPNIPVSYVNLGVCYALLNEHENSIFYFQKALDVYTRIYQEDSPCFVEVYNKMGLSYKALGNGPKSLEMLSTAVTVYHRLNETEHPSVADLYNNIGIHYQDCREFDKSVEYFSRALGIYLEFNEAEHESVAVTLNNLGYSYQFLADFKKAIEHYNKALSVKYKLYGAGHPRVANTLNNIAKFYQTIEDYDQSNEYFMKTLSIEYEIFDENHPSIEETLTSIAFNYEKLGNI
jgi:tetratricopeptide (TPR) repeat protein